MKQLLITYDYELFFGVKSGTVKKSIIEPTNFILSDLERYGFTGTFFVDYLMLKYLKLADGQRAIDDLIEIENQLKDIVKRGHRIELHIHPHWVDAKYNGDGTWDYTNYSHYSLDSFSEEAIINMFVEGVQLLTNIAREVDPSYEICAFRAGGWAVQPFQKLAKAFKAANIRIDSSVAYGAYYKCAYSCYDFRNDLVKDKNTYWFNDDVLEPLPSGFFLEVPIASFRRYTFYRVCCKLYRLFTHKCEKITDGTHYRPDLPKFKVREYAMCGLSDTEPLSCAYSILSKKNSLVVLMCHPKDYTFSHRSCLRILSHFVKSTNYLNIYNNIVKKVI